MDGDFIGVYSVYDSYEYLFLYDGMNSNEVILQMPFAEGVRTSQIPRHLGAVQPRAIRPLSRRRCWWTCISASTANASIALNFTTPRSLSRSVIPDWRIRFFIRDSGMQVSDSKLIPTRSKPRRSSTAPYPYCQ